MTKKRKRKTCLKKNAAQIGSRNRRSRVKVIAKVDGEKGAQSNKLRNWENERGRKFKKN